MYRTKPNILLLLFTPSVLQTWWVSLLLSLFLSLLLQRMNVVVKPGLPMLIAGSCSPCAAVSVSAIGASDSADKNKEHSARIFEFLSRELGLSEDRWASSPHISNPQKSPLTGAAHTQMFPVRAKYTLTSFCLKCPNVFSQFRYGFHR